MRDLLGPPVTQPIAEGAALGLSIPALRDGNVRVLLGTIFTELSSPPDARWGYAGHNDADRAYEMGVRQLRIYQELERAGEIRIVRSREDLEAAATGGAPGLVILMECADPIRSPDEAAWWHAQGVRVVGLAWGRGSRYAGGNSTGGELTALGRAIVGKFDRLGILHDVSHLSDQAFAELCGATRARIVATHSNVRALVEPIQRHLTDEQIGEIARRDGIVGLNLFSKFLAKGRPATAQDAVAHVQHVASIAGRQRTGLGSDFDGGFTPAECAIGCQRPQELNSLTDALHQAGWSEAECRGFAHDNWMRVLRDVL